MGRWVERQFSIVQVLNLFNLWEPRIMATWTSEDSLRLSPLISKKPPLPTLKQGSSSNSSIGDSLTAVGK
jgi:hypothetical protein